MSWLRKLGSLYCGHSSSVGALSALRMNRAIDKPKEQPQEVITMDATKLEELVKTLDA